MTIAIDELIQTIRQLPQVERDYVVTSLINTGEVEHSHSPIVSDKKILGGEPVVAGTKTPVRAIVELWRIGTAPEEIPEHLPHLTLSQIFDALSYYADHKREINRYIEINRVPEELIHPAVKAKIAHQ